MPRSSFDFDRGVTQWRMEPITGSPRAGQWAFTLGYDGEVPRYEDIAYGDYFQTSQEIDTTNVGLIRCHVNISQPRTLPDFEDVSTDLQFIEESSLSPGNRIVISRGLSESDINRTLSVAGATNGGNNGTIKIVGIADSITAYVDATVVTEGPSSAITASLLGARWKFSLLIDGTEYARCIQSNREAGFYRNDLMLHCSKLTGSHTISFRITLIEHEADNVYGFFPEPPSEGLVFWVKGDVGLESTAGQATAWRDQSGFGQDVTDLTLNPGPYTGLDTIDGVPCLTFPLATNPNLGLYRPTGLRDRNGIQFGFGSGEHQPRTLVAVIRPRFAAAAFNITGGIVAQFGSVPLYQLLFDLEDTVHSDGFYLWSGGWRNPSSGTVDGPDTAGGAGGIYDGVPLLGMWSTDAVNNIAVSINNVNQTLTPSTFPGAAGATVNPIFTIGRTSSGQINFFGEISEVLVWDYDITTNPVAQARLIDYVTSRYPSIGL